MIKGFKRSIAVAIATLALIGIAAVPAQAWYSDCPTSGGYTCVWDGAAYSGAVKLIGTANGHTLNTCYNFSTSWNNKIESMTNHALGIALYVWTNAGCTGSYYYIYPTEDLASLGAWNNTMSSFKLYVY